MEDLSTLSQRQIKARKIVGNQYKTLLEKEIEKINKYLTRVDTVLTTNPSLPKKPYQGWTEPQLKEAQTVYNHVLMRIKGLEMDVLPELKEIDKELVNLQP